MTYNYNMYYSTKLDEVDIDRYIERFAREWVLNYLWTKYIILIEQYILKMNQNLRKNIVCIQETAESFINKVTEYISNNIKTSTNLKIVKKVSIENT